jgi:hypothetical protein
MRRAYSTHGEGRNTYRILAENPEGARPLGRPRSRWKVEIKTAFREIGWGDIGQNLRGSACGAMEGSCDHNNGPLSSKRLENSWVAERLVASQEGLSSMELVSYLV